LWKIRPVKNGAVNETPGRRIGPFVMCRGSFGSPTPGSPNPTVVAAWVATSPASNAASRR
jgi:hypothetical protein